MLKKVGKNYKIIHNISEGTQIYIYKGIHIKTNLEVAIKTEPLNTQSPHLIYECKLYNYLHNDSSVIDKGIPNVYYCSSEGQYKVLVMDLMGPSLEQLFNRCLRKFSLKTVLMLINQMISRVQYIHNKNFLHRDLMPESFCIGLNKLSHKIYLLGLGHLQKFPKVYRGCRKGEKIFRPGPQYASINTHLYIDLSQRDDMETIGYIAMRFLRGMLPWQGLKANNKNDQYEKIKDKKLSTPIEVLCKGYPKEFANYLTKCRSLRYDQKPDYSAMKSMFQQLFLKNGYEYDYKYDWVVLAEKQEKQQSKETSV